MFVKLLALYLTIMIAFAAFLNTWVTDDDISGLPKDGVDRFTSLMYFSVTTFTSTGYGDMAPKSKRARLVMSAYMTTALAGTVYIALIQEKLK